MTDFMRLYSNLIERCFLSCAQDFTSKALSTNEVSVEYQLPDMLVSSREKKDETFKHLISKKSNLRLLEGGEGKPSCGHGVVSVTSIESSLRQSERGQGSSVTATRYSRIRNKGS